jgi:peroxiredoxin
MEFPMVESTRAAMRRRRLLALVVGCALAGPGLAMAQAPGAAAAAATRLEGRTLDGRPFTLESQRGKVVVLLFWSTACAVCRDLMPELRANYAGWAGRPFELVTVSTDARRQDALDYEQLLQRIVPLTERFPSLWRAEAGHQDGFGALAGVPTTFVIDPEGRIAAQYSGRLPPAAWDRVAELLP